MDERQQKNNFKVTISFDIVKVTPKDRPIRCIVDVDDQSKTVILQYNNEVQFHVKEVTNRSDVFIQFVCEKQNKKLSDQRLGLPFAANFQPEITDSQLISLENDELRILYTLTVQNIPLIQQQMQLQSPLQSTPKAIKAGYQSGVKSSSSNKSTMKKKEEAPKSSHHASADAPKQLQRTEPATSPRPQPETKADNEQLQTQIANLTKANLTLKKNNQYLQDELYHATNKYEELKGFVESLGRQISHKISPATGQSQTHESTALESVQTKSPTGQQQKKDAGQTAALKAEIQRLQLQMESMEQLFQQQQSEYLSKLSNQSSLISQLHQQMEELKSSLSFHQDQRPVKDSPRFESQYTPVAQFQDQWHFQNENEHEMDAAVRKFINSSKNPEKVALQFARQGPGVYLVGGKKAILLYEKGQLFIKIGGGQIELGEYLSWDESSQNGKTMTSQTWTSGQKSPKIQSTKTKSQTYKSQNS